MSPLFAETQRIAVHLGPVPRQLLRWKMLSNLHNRFRFTVSTTWMKVLLHTNSSCSQGLSSLSKRLQLPEISSLQKTRQILYRRLSASRNCMKPSHRTALSHRIVAELRLGCLPCFECNIQRATAREKCSIRCFHSAACKAQSFRGAIDTIRPATPSTTLVGAFPRLIGKVAGPTHSRSSINVCRVTAVDW